MQTKELRILLVDDDEDEYIITDMLLSEGSAAPFILEWAESYQDALLLVQNQAWDVILLDTVEGHKSSLDFVRKLKTLVNTPIINYTGFDYPGYVEEAMKAGAASFLSKRKVSAELLWNVIRTAQVERTLAPEAVNSCDIPGR